MSRTTIILLSLLGIIVWGTAQAKPPKFYFELRGVKTPERSKPDLKEKARALLVAEFNKQPAVIMDLGDPKPTGDEIEKRLKTRKVQGFALLLRITKYAHSLNPPPPGKTYKVLTADVAVAIDAEKIPSGQMAIAGEGDTQVSTEVKGLKEKERVQLMEEALTEAIRQAVSKSIVKLGTANKAASHPPRKKR